jgi:hypothetical protein
MTESRTVRAAAVQIAPDLDALAGTLDRVLAAIAEAASKGAEIIVFPETFLPWYPYFSIVHGPALIGDEHIRLYKNAVVAPGPVTEALSAAARQHHIVISIGINERDHGTLYNSLLIFDADGSLQLKHRKLSPAYHERMIWGVGDGSTLKVVDTAVGRVGGLICWEHYNPLARYALMAQHEDIQNLLLAGIHKMPACRRADQAIMVLEIHDRPWHATLVEIGGRGASEQPPGRDPCPDEARVCQIAGTDGEVISLSNQVGDPVAEIDRQAHLGITRRKIVENGDQRIFAQRHRAGDAQQPMRRARIADHSQRLVPRGKNSLAPFQKDNARFGEAHLPGCAIEQLRLQL